MSCSKGWSRTSNAEGLISTMVELVSGVSEWATTRIVIKRVKKTIFINM